MCRFFLILCILLCLTIPLHAQHNPTGYDIALKRIQNVAEAGATELDLSYLDLTEVPPEVWQLTNLQMLYLHYNQLTNISSEIGQLTNLRDLLMNSNELTSIPSEIGQLTNLQGLWLNNNELTSIPSEIGQLTNLRWLSLENNQLRYLPIEMGNLTNLTCADCSLFVEGNPLISPPLEVVAQGVAAVLDYLRNQAWYHVQRLIIGGALGVGMLTILILGVRWKQRGGRKLKQKREAVY